MDCDFSDIDMGELGRQIFCRLLKATASEGSYNETIEECRERGQPFNDEAFPANQNSLISNWKDEHARDKVSQWK
jgi:hypothetical protein